jgi:hypothetical protein
MIVKTATTSISVKPLLFFVGFLSSLLSFIFARLASAIRYVHLLPKVPFILRAEFRNGFD